MKKNQNPKPKRPYEKPKLRSIGLVADEVLVTGCKTGLSTGPEGIGANCSAIPCVNNGS